MGEEKADAFFASLWFAISLCFRFRLQNTGQPGSRLVEHTDELGGWRQQESQEPGLENIPGRKIGQGIDLDGTQDGIVKNARLDWRPFEFRHEGFEDFRRRTNVILACDHSSLTRESAV